MPVVPFGGPRGGEAAVRADPRAPLVIGIGNPLRGDDALGWHAARRLAADPRLAGAEVLWRHQLTPELAVDLASTPVVVLVDAEAGAAPGAVGVRHLRGAGGGEVLTHHVAPEALLALAAELYGASPDAWVVSVGLAATDAGAPLSADVEAALPGVVDAVVAILEDRPHA